MAKAIWAHCDRSSERLLVKSPGYQQALSIRWRHANFIDNECEVQKLASVQEAAYMFFLTKPFQQI